MKNYFLTLKRLFTDPTVYRMLLNQKARLSLLHFTFSYAILSLIVSIVIGIFIAPGLIDHTITNATGLAASYPDDLVIHITPQSMTVDGANTPIALPLSTPYPDSNIKNLVIIDPSAIAEDASGLGTAFLLTDNALVVNLDRKPDDISIIPWENFQIDTYIDKSVLEQELIQIEQLLQAAKVLSIPLIFFTVFCFLCFIRLFNALLYSLIFSFIGSFIKRPYPFRSYFNISLYTSVIAEAVYLITLAIYRQPFSSLYTITFLGISALVIYTLPRAIRIRS